VKTEFLDQCGIIKYPPPIYAFSWDSLNWTEKHTALRKLQTINYDFRQGLESRTEQILPKLKLVQIQVKFKTGEKSDVPKEWRPWEMLSEDERKAAFETLKV
jgi:hypothetical protein